MEKSQYLGYQIHTLDNMIGRIVCSYRARFSEKEGLTLMQSWIIDYLFKHSEEDMFQKNIEAEFHIARSTATGILQLMEKKGFLTKTPSTVDGRLKLLRLTDKAVALQLAILENTRTLEDMLKQDISPDELEIFLSVVQKMKHNIETETLTK